MAAIVAAPALVLLATAFARFFNVRGSIDLAVFDQGIWNLSRGRAPEVSLIGETLLGDHFGPGFLLFALPYRLIASPLWLIGGQMVAAFIAAWLVARRLAPHIGERWAGAVGAGLLISPPVAYAVLFDVHSVVFAVPFALAAIFALEDGRPRWAMLFGIAAALFRIEIGAGILLAFAVWPGSRRGRLAAGAILAAYVLAAFGLESMVGEADYWAIHYGHLGPSPGQALLHPMPLIETMFSAETLRRAFPWLATTAFLALRRPRLVLPALLISVPVLLSQWPGTGSIIFQYGLAPTFLLAAAAQREIRTEATMRAAIAFPVVLALMLGPFLPPVADTQSYFLGRYWGEDTSEVKCLIEGIPDDAGVSAGRAITLLSHRQHLYLWPFPFAGTPASTLPAEHLSRANPELAAKVDYLIVARTSTDPIPPGFELDVDGTGYDRYRRTVTTQPAQPRCEA
jgi:uncharacterized membrane protein